MLLGLGVGLLGGFGAVGVDLTSKAISELLFGLRDPSAQHPGFWRALLVPGAGGLVAGLLLWWGLARDRPVGVADVIESVTVGGGRLPLRDSLLTALAATVVLGTGGGGGREGPVMQLGAGLASRLAQAVGLPELRLRVLVAAGGSAGIAASFNTPIAAAFFSMELLLGSFAADMFAPIVVATVTGTVVGQAFLGDRLPLLLPPFAIHHPAEIASYIGLGLVVGLVSVGFKQTVFWVDDQVRTLRLPRWSLGGLFGLLTGLVGALGLHQVLGNGNGALQNLLGGAPPAAWVLVLLLVAKTLVSAAFFAARTGVGLFSPTMFVGATTGALFGLGLERLAPGLGGGHGAYGLVGMGAALAATTHAPITAVLMLFEMTRNYQVILPLMLALSVASLVSRSVSPNGLYTETLRRRGVRPQAGREELVMTELRVRDVMHEELERLPAQAPAAEAARRFMTRRLHLLYLVDEAGRLEGVLDILDVRELLGRPQEGLLAAQIPRQPVPTLQPTQSLADCLPIFYRAEREELPVVDEGGVLLGALAERDIVGAYTREVLRSDALLARVDSGEGEERSTDYIELPEGETVASVEVGARLAGASLKDLALPARHGVTVLAVSVRDPRTGALRRQHLDPARKLGVGDRLVVLGPEAGVKAVQQLAGLEPVSGVDDATEELPRGR